MALATKARREEERKDGDEAEDGQLGEENEEEEKARENKLRDDLCN